MSFFEIIGIVVCVFVVLLILGVLFLVWKLKRAFSDIKDSLGDLQMPMALPARIHPLRREKLTWADEEAVNKLLQPLWRLGFQDAGSYEIEEMPGVKVRGLARPEETLWAVVYEHPQAGAWMDFVTRYADENGSTIGSLTTSNASQGDELEHRPNHDKIYDKSLDADGLYQRHLAARRTDISWHPVMPENFQAEFEKAYANEMDWRFSRGGVTEDELRAIAAKSGTEVTDEEIKMLREANEMQAASALSEAVREKFLEQTSMPAAEWERLRERLVIVHDHMSAQNVAQEFQAWTYNENDNYDEAEGEDDEPTYPQELTPRQGFEYLNSTLTPARRFEKLAEIEEPVPAHIWRVPDVTFNQHE